MKAVWRPTPARGIKRPTPPGINLYPEAVSLSKAVASHIKDSNWNSYTLFYDDDQGKINPIILNELEICRFNFSIVDKAKNMACIRFKSRILTTYHILP